MDGFTKQYIFTYAIYPLSSTVLTCCIITDRVVRTSLYVTYDVGVMNAI